MGRQVSRKHMKEQNRDPGIKESSNLTHAEFKRLVIKMLHELRGSVDEFSDNFNKEIKNIRMEMKIIKGNQSEMKNTLFEMKSILDGVNKVDKEEEQPTDMENGEVKDSQNGKKRKSRL